MVIVRELQGRKPFPTFCEYRPNLAHLIISLLGMEPSQYENVAADGVIFKDACKSFLSYA